MAASSAAIAQLATLLGPPAVWKVAPKLGEIAMQLLQAEHPCQQETEALDEDDDNDGALWEAVSAFALLLACVLQLPTHSSAPFNLAPFTLACVNRAFEGRRSVPNAR